MNQDPELHDTDAGEPVTLLRDFAEDAPREFMTIVRRKINRRSSTAQLADFSWRVPGMLLVEFAHLLRALFGSGREGYRK